ncbi:MAG: deoxyribodipyrimidine photo-lyase [Parachlamydiales bacterium]|nr:deoxyribodipyrimidine photo-lyase [Parachlamydiales bacterium]
MKDQSPIIFWFKKDLRLLDNPALHYAAKENRPIIIIYIHSPKEHDFWNENSLQSNYLHNSLEKLSNHLKKKKLKLHVFEGKADQILKSVIKKTKAKSLFFNFEYEPKIYKRDQKIIKDFEKQNIDVKPFHGNLLHNPNDIKTKLGYPYQIYTQFYNSAKKYQTIEKPKPIPKKLISKDFSLGSKPLDNLKLKKNKSFEKILNVLWPAGEDAALKKFKSFLSKKIKNYKKLRDFPGIDGTSLMSHHLHFGEIGPKYIFHTAKKCSSSTIYIKEIYWREFSKYILFHFPKTETKPLKKEFENFSWKKNERLFKAWCDGKTGYPIIDAAMRQLNKAGWMHNRCRMLTASFLVKDLLQN